MKRYNPFNQHIISIIRLVGTIILLAVAWVGPSLVLAQGGCPARPTSSVLLEETVTQVISILAAIPETQASQARGVFVQQTVTFTYAPGQRVWLTSFRDGDRLGDLCTDDVAMVSVTQSGKTWQHDFRSPDRETILSTPAVDITELFVPGINTITLMLTDLASPASSTSGYMLVMAGDATAPPLLFPTATRIIPSPTPRPIPTPTRARPKTVPVVEVIGAKPPTFPADEKIVTPQSPPSGLPRQLLWLGVSGAAVLTLLWGVRRSRSQTQTPPGQVDLYAGTQFIQTWDLASLGKAVITLGGEGADIVLPNAQGPVPPVVARILAKPTPTGDSQAICELLDPEDPKVVLDRQVLHHGDALSIYNEYRLEYSHYQIETSNFFEGAYINV